MKLQKSLATVIALLCAMQLFGQNVTTINRYFLIEPYREVAPIKVAEDIEPLLRPRPIFALKTNLLFDALTAINIEAEVPIGNRWSIAGELIFLWWTMDNHHADSRRNRLQLINGTIEPKYWWGERSRRALMTGWFTSLYSSLGTYDIEYKARGYQGSTLFSVGIGGGYSHPINRHETLRMEYSVGVGYMTTFYRHYHAEFCDNDRWHAVEYNTGRLRWVGPTRAKVSLVWMIDLNNKR